MKTFFVIWAFVVVLTVSILGFRSDKFTQPPIYIFDDMDWQAKYTAQAENTFYPDGRDDRPMVPGTAMRGYSWETKEIFVDEYRFDKAENPPLYTGKHDDGSWYEGFPVEVDLLMIEEGREKYQIFCAVCHGESGNGVGVLAANDQRTANIGYFGNIASFHQDRLRAAPEGYIFDVITNGYNTMYPYGMKLTPEERWAVIAYVRALQLASHASVDELPPNVKTELGL